MLVSASENNIQALAAVRDLTGHDLRLLPLDEITALEAHEDGFDVWITRYRWSERKREIRVEGRGVVLVQFREKGRYVGSMPVTYNAPQGTWYMESHTAWDAEQCSENMADAIRRQDMAGATLWMTLQTALAKMGDFTPFNIPHYGTHQSVSEWVAKVKRERMAGRVGTSSFPLDTYDRTMQGSTPRMGNHWRG